MKNRVLDNKIKQNELYNSYLRGMVTGSLVVIGDVEKRLLQKDKTPEEIIAEITEYCVTNRNRLAKKSTDEVKEDESE